MYCKRVSAVEDLDQEGWDRVKIAYARPAAMVTGRAYVELGRREWAKNTGSEARGLSTGGFYETIKRVRRSLNRQNGM